MKRIAVASALMVMLSAAAAQAQAPAPGPEHQKLVVFVGTWTGEGMMEASPFGKGGPTRSTMTCSRFAGGYHLVCDSDDSMPMGEVKAHSVYGYDTEKKQYYSFGIESNGFGGPMTAKVEESDWTFEGNGTMQGKSFWYRTVLRIVSPNELTYSSEYSEDGRTWNVHAMGRMVKK